MFTVFDAAGVILIGCLAVVWHHIPLLSLRSGHWTLLGVAVASCVVVRAASGSEAALDVIAAWLLAYTALTLGRRVIALRVWPVQMFTIALVVVTAVGTYLRADRLNEVMGANRPLSPDVEYYLQQAQCTANPFAAGHKSPLWSALNAPLVRLMTDPNVSMRALSWCCGIAMLPLAGLALGRLLNPVVGVLTAGMLAVEPWLIDLCCEGLREEAGVCLWMVALLLLFDVAPADRVPADGAPDHVAPASRRCVSVAFRNAQDTPHYPLLAGLVGGIMLLLRNISVVPLFVLILWTIVHRRCRSAKAAAVLLLPLLIVAPFYVNQYRAFGDPFAMEKRDARYHANIEFQTTAPPSLPMPSREAWKEDLFAGEPLSPLAYLLKHRSLADFAGRQWTGLTRVLTGQPFNSMANEWFRLACAAGVIASLAVARARFLGLFVLSSTAGISAHLLAIGQLELRLLLPVFVLWLAAGWWLIVSIAQVAMRRVTAAGNNQM